MRIRSLLELYQSGGLSSVSEAKIMRTRKDAYIYCAVDCSHDFGLA